MKYSKTRCRGITSKGERCKNNAKIAGYCKLHVPEYPYPILDDKKPARDRLQDAANVATTLGGLVTLIEYCIKEGWFDDLKLIFSELEPQATEVFLSLGGYINNVQAISGQLTVELALFKWYDSIEQQELEYRIYKTFEAKHDLAYNKMMEKLDEANA
ncbi:DUF5763 domain-containing protein [Vibrio alginolyticus]|uniref:DUF5763 domain-containing protein n=1 Tax=Vibrio alginolyticus TaxID=663 RepID=UPI00215C4C8A|nr:DUF5763 domain-containing protein [Vibrio alginolyticus]MCR9903625.1 DUF5763 domain-containing protein [Vibrio alginolyticus]